MYSIGQDDNHHMRIMWPPDLKPTEHPRCERRVRQRSPPNTKCGNMFSKDGVHPSTGAQGIRESLTRRVEAILEVH